MTDGRKPGSERGQLDLFRALPGDIAPRDAQDLMAYPFFSLAKSKRVAPIDFAAGSVSIRVEAVPDHGMATIWDADILIWAASQIVEAKDANPEELAVTFCNSGVMAGPWPLMAELLGEVMNDNAKGEYYLTDLVALARGRGLKAHAAPCDEEHVLGVNSRVQLAEAEAVFQKRRRNELLEAGVGMIAPETVFFSHDTQIANDVEIEPNVVFGPGVTVESGAQIRAFSHLEGAVVSGGAQIGPYARLRPGAQIGNDVRVGNFVEVKNVKMGKGAKANHLSYLGDGQVGAGANIGAGTIFCNYDGFFKYQTVIGEGAFVGSNSALVAPVTIGEGAMIGSGSVITSDVKPGDLAVGRSRQTSKEGWALSFRTIMKARKAARAKG